ncbi:MAG: hypothetical protein N2423_04745, partial [Novosphingobium sp.]|nr:hypothetical protein [Novosphingobium sp.]
NLFALMGPQALPALALWSSVEQDRKKVWRIFARFGPWLMLRALSRTISLDSAVASAGARLGLRAGVVRMSRAEAVMDVDKPADHALAERIIASREA